MAPIYPRKYVMSKSSNHSQGPSHEAGQAPRQGSPDPAAKWLRQAALWCAASALWAPLSALAQTTDGKIAGDLGSYLPTTSSCPPSKPGQPEIACGEMTIAPPDNSWAKTVNGVQYAKIVVVSNSTDPTLAALRRAVLDAGGSVYQRYLAVRAVSAMVPVARLTAIAARQDVVSISPNRFAARTLSLLEQATGLSTARQSSFNGQTADGTGVGIAILDSGIAWNHRAFRTADGTTSRVRKAVDYGTTGISSGGGGRGWTPGQDTSNAFAPGSSLLEMRIANDKAPRPDVLGHGTHVASVAAGRTARAGVESAGLAVNANLYDVKVLKDDGTGMLSDVLAGIDWVIYHAREYNIRVMNVSLATNGNESYQTDPLCRAVRSATAAGITVVAAAGNFGLAIKNSETYGSIGSPAIDPTVITVGSAHGHDTAARTDETINKFSSRGPTRGKYIDANSVARRDNFLKPDLVATGNRIVGALATDSNGSSGSANTLAANYSELTKAFGGLAQPANQAVMYLSGTSISAPVVSGAVAMMLQVNPGLTPPLIKAILQYTAEARPGANLLQQGTGLLNVEAALKVASVLRTDIAASVERGSIRAGDSLLASGKSLPLPSSSILGTSAQWSRLVTAGGNHLLTGNILLTHFQPIYDHRLTWAGPRAHRMKVTWGAVAPLTNMINPVIVGGERVPVAASPARPVEVPVSFDEVPAASQGLILAGVGSASRMAGQSSLRGRTGVFRDVATLAAWVRSGSGDVLSQGVILAEGVVLAEGMVLAEGLVLSESNHKGEP